MNKIHEWINTVLVAFVLVLVLVGGNHQSGSLGATPTTFLPSYGFTSIAVGTGCDQQYTTCTAASIFPSGSIVTSGGLYAGQGLTEGGLDAIATTSTNYTLLQSDLLSASLVSFTANGGSATINLPASSTLTSYIPNAGDITSEVFYNASTTAAITLTVAGGTGTTLLSASSTAIIQSQKAANLKFVRLPNTSIIVLMSTAN